MIRPGTRFVGPERIPLERITVAPQAVYYPDVVERYRERLTDPDHPEDDVLIHVEPCGFCGAAGKTLSLYRVVDGRHRFIASLLAGRRDILALIEYPPTEDED